MKRKAVMIGVVLLTSGVLMTPPLAVSEKTRDYCEKLADKQLPILTAPEKEAFIADCLADASATQGK